MKLKLAMAAVAAACSLLAGQAAAYSPTQCTLELVSDYNPIPVGQSYGLRVTISFVDFGPLPPPSYEPFAVVYHGTRDGVPDTGSGQYLHNAPGNSPKTVTTYNPGGIPGTYLRYALIYRNGQFVCSTNTILAGLL